jgi:oxygen-independent coproporphyrinogen-3 oxidase
MEEAWFLGLRLNEGVSLAGHCARSSRHPQCANSSPRLPNSKTTGLVTFVGGDRVALTARGGLLSNEVFERFLAEPAVA